MRSPASNDRGRGLWAEIKRGAGRLPSCGAHPGTGILFGLIGIGAATGAGATQPAWAGGLIGFALSAAVYLPMWLIGCVDRSRCEDRINRSANPAPGKSSNT